MRMPTELRYRRVDEIIECYGISKETQAELLELMPEAYGGDPPGEDDWPEPDSARDEPYKLAKIWSKLSDEAKRDIAQAAGA